MRIFISCPGFFYKGFNSKLRGEGRWLVHMAGVLKSSGHDVTIFSNELIRSYEDRGVIFNSIHSSGAPTDCDVLVAMDAFEDVPHLSKTDITLKLNRFKAKKRVAALFFPTDKQVYDYIPVIHPWNYTQIKQGMGHFIPIITHNSIIPPDFTRTRFHWYSKRPNDEPRYLPGVLKALRCLVQEHGATGGLFVDGAWLMSNDYRDNCLPGQDIEARQIFKEIMQYSDSESLANWVPYNYIRDAIGKSKLLVGIHHPVAAPSTAEIASVGGMPIIFENQKQCPPYDTCDLSVIPTAATDEEIEQFIVRAWTDKAFFEKSVLTCQEAISEHAQDRAALLINKFFEEL